MMAGSISEFTVIRGDVYMNVDRMIAELRDDGGDENLIWWLTECRKAAKLAIEHEREECA